MVVCGMRARIGSAMGSHRRLAARLDRKIGGRPTKLNAAQLQELRSEVLGRPDMSYWQLRDLVWARFRLQYSVSNLRRLLRTELQIVRMDRTFRAA
jgi:transposase